METECFVIFVERNERALVGLSAHIRMARRVDFAPGNKLMNWVGPVDKRGTNTNTNTQLKTTKVDEMGGPCR